VEATVLWAFNDYGLYKSSDCGANWSLVSTGQGSDQLRGSSLWSMVIDPIDIGTMYVVAGYGALGLWKSTNGGVDWRDLVPAGSDYARIQEYRFVNNISMDPENHRHILFTTHGGCASPYSGGCNGESFDGGETWRFSSSPIGWAEGGGVMLLNATTWLWNDPFGGIWRTRDNGATSEQVLQGNGGNGEFTLAPMVPAADGAYYISSVGGALRSDDGGASWERLTNFRSVGLAVGKERLFAADQWSTGFQTAALATPKQWSDLPSPPTERTDDGAPFLIYDEDHKILYASMWRNGLWRMVIE
jgi:photosystem II stability/assembly factor-like uncharacterized protein